MKILISIPSGFHSRELLMPLKELLSNDSDISHIYCVSPGAPYKEQIFPDYSDKFIFLKNPENQSKHEELLTQYKPDLVITNTSGLDPRDTSILQATKKLNMKTLTFIASWDNVWKMERLKKKGGAQVLANHFIVWNQMMHDHLLKIFPELTTEQIFIIGAPRLDFFFHENKIPSRQELLNYLNIPDDGGKLIHFATTELYPMEYIIKATQKTTHKIHSYISVHPGGKIEPHKNYAKKYNATVRYSFGRQENSPDPSFKYNPTFNDIYMLVALFKHSDLLINHSSTATIESFLGNTPIINVKYGITLDWWRWYRSMVYRDFGQHYLDITSGKSTALVKNERQLIKAVTDYLNNPQLQTTERQQTLQKMITTTDGTASQKVIYTIKNL
jgi:CDP-glycerol glycerophosphotransferase (TagB/SpsB family)